jgi:hypothetical protein
MIGGPDEKCYFVPIKTKNPKASMQSITQSTNDMSPMTY